MGRRGRVRYPFFGCCPERDHDWRSHLEEPPAQCRELCSDCLDEMRENPCELRRDELPEPLRSVPHGEKDLSAGSWLPVPA